MGTMKGGEFSGRSLEKLNTCDLSLQLLFLSVVQSFDCTVVCGYRKKHAQNKAFKQGFSGVEYPNSKHNTIPSSAIDVYPYPVPRLPSGEIDNNSPLWEEFMQFVKEKAKEMGIVLVCGGDWAKKDYPHYEIETNYPVEI